MEDPPEGEPRLDWRKAVPTLAAVFIATRLIVVLIAVMVEVALPLPHENDAFDDRPILSSLTTADGVYYLGIAAEGYHQEPVKFAYRDWVFFPLYPLAVKAASVLTLGDIGLAAVLVSNAA